MRMSRPLEAGMGTMDGMERIKELYSEQVIHERIRELGEQITRDYRGRDTVVICVLKGALFFMADLCRAIDLPVTIDTLGMSSYGDQTSSSGVVRITQDLSRPIVGKHVIVVEDIVDTGLTLNFLINNLRSRMPESIEVCALLHKPARTKVPVEVKYLGFVIEDRFVVGYGLDWEQRYRNIRYVGVVD